MDVFVSWSGDYSRRVALALKEWLPLVIQSAHPFVSDKDIHSGSRWQTEIALRLERTNFGIIVVTSDNQGSPWLQFEAGALSKSLEDSRVVPLLVDITKNDLLLPLNMFQAETLDPGGIEALLLSMSAALPEPLSEATVTQSAEMWWTKLDEAVAAAQPGVSLKKPRRSDRELLEEVLTRVREFGNLSSYAPIHFDISQDNLMPETRSKGQRNRAVAVARSVQDLLENEGILADGPRARSLSDGAVEFIGAPADLSPELKKMLTDLAAKSGVPIFIGSTSQGPTHTFPPF